MRHRSQTDTDSADNTITITITITIILTTMTTNIYITTKEGRTEHATNWKDAKQHWDRLEADGYNPVEFTGDV